MPSEYLQKIIGSNVKPSVKLTRESFERMIKQRELSFGPYKKQGLSKKITEAVIPINELPADQIRANSPLTIL